MPRQVLFACFESIYLYLSAGKAKMTQKWPVLGYRAHPIPTRAQFFTRMRHTCIDVTCKSINNGLLTIQFTVHSVPLTH